MEGYRVKCKAKREMNDAQEVVTEGKSGRKTRMMKGVCPECGTKMNRILGPVKE